MDYRRRHTTVDRLDTRGLPGEHRVVKCSNLPADRILNDDPNAKFAMRRLRRPIGTNQTGHLVRHIRERDVRFEEPNADVECP